MRERASRLTSVDAVIVNGGEAKTGEIPMHLQPGLAINLVTGERRSVSELPSLVAMAGVVIRRASSRRWNSVVPGWKNAFRWPTIRRWWKGRSLP